MCVKRIFSDISDESSEEKDPSCLALTLLRPIIRQKKNNKTAVKLSDIKIWLNATRELISILASEDKHAAKSLAYNFLSTYFLVFTLCLTWMGYGPRLLHFVFGEGSVEEYVLDELISIITSDEWKKTFIVLGINNLVDTLLSVYAYSLQKIIKESEKIISERLMNKLFIILERAPRLNEILDKIRKEDEDILESSISVIYSVFPMAIEGIVRNYISAKNVNEKNSLKKEVIGLLSNFCELNLAKSIIKEDINKQSLYHTLLIVKSVLIGDVHKAVERTRKLGLFLMHEKMKSIGLNERLILRLPPETGSLPVSATSPPISISDRLSETNLLSFINEIIEEATNWNFEIKSIFKSLLLIDPRGFLRYLLRCLTNPLSSLTIQFLLGSPIALVLEALIPYAEIEDERRHVSSELINIIDIATRILKSMLVVTQYLEKKFDWGKSEITRKIIGFYLYREIFLTSHFFTPAFQKFLSKSSRGQAFLRLINNISNYLEKLIGRKIEKKEDISDLFA